MCWVGLIGLLFLPIVCHAQLLENSILTDTSVIGTSEQPTIEGGIISTLHTKPEHENFTHHDIDEFYDDKNIKAILKNAAKDGKLSYVLQRAEALKLPATVALIPMVESCYQTNSISPKGAAGAWQLMPETAKNYGLNAEDRENFTLSTHTALQLLKNLHQQFGNWTLAFAAYNAGTHRVLCAVRQHPHAQFVHELGLPLETEQYVFRLKMLYRAIAKYSVDTGSI